MSSLPNQNHAAGNNGKSGSILDRLPPDILAQLPAIHAQHKDELTRYDRYARQPRSRRGAKEPKADGAPPVLVPAGEPVAEPRVIARLRAVAKMLSMFRHDTPEGRQLLKVAGV